jgi:hypothetical protein
MKKYGAIVMIAFSACALSVLSTNAFAGLCSCSSFPDGSADSRCTSYPSGFYSEDNCGSGSCSDCPSSLWHAKCPCLACVSGSVPYLYGCRDACTSNCSSGQTQDCTSSIANAANATKACVQSGDCMVFSSTCTLNSCNTCYKKSGNTCVAKSCSEASPCGTINMSSCTCGPGTCPSGATDSVGTYVYTSSGSCSAPS